MRTVGVRMMLMQLLQTMMILMIRRFAVSTLDDRRRHGGIKVMQKTACFSSSVGVSMCYNKFVRNTRSDRNNKKNNNVPT
jgi:L-ribulose-5-phosphate 3-epimerase UlaE